METSKPIAFVITLRTGYEVEFKFTDRLREWIISLKP